MLARALITLSLLSCISASTNPPRFIVLSGRTLRPGMVYNVAVLIISEELQEVSVHTNLIKDQDEVLAQASLLVPTNVFTSFPIKIAMSTPPGEYILLVEGKDQGTVLFRNTSQLTFDRRFLSMVVQTSRPIYRAGQEVKFRVVAIHTDLRPFNDGLEIHILDPDGFIMRRWVSAYTNNGVSSLSFNLPKLAKDGYWKIRIKAWNQIEEQLIKVETYFDPLFEVHVKLPSYTLEEEEFLTGSVVGLYTTQRIVKGNGTLTLLARKWQDDDSFLPLWSEQVFFTGDEHEVRVPLAHVAAAFDSLRGLELRLEAAVTELLSRETSEGFSHTRLVSGRPRLTFLSSAPSVFRPGMPFFTHVAINYEDMEKLSEEQLESSRLRVQIELELDSGHRVRLPDIVAGKGHENIWDYNENSIQDEFKERFIDKSSHDDYLENGVLKFSFLPLNNTEKITIKAYFEGDDGSLAEAHLEAIKYFSPTNKFISVTSSSSNVIVGEYAIFHVKSNFRMDSFQYLVISKSEIISCGDYKSDNVSIGAATLSLSLSRAVAPGFRLVVFHISADSEILSDSCFLPVDGFSMYNTELEINTGKDHKGERVEVRASGGEGAFIGVHATRAAAYTLQAGNDISLARMVSGLMALDNSSWVFNKIYWKVRDGTAPDHIQFFMAMDSAYDTNRTFSLLGLNIFSSTDIHYHEKLGPCDMVNELPCDSISCYPANKTCDGETDCSSGYDELMCPSNQTIDYEYKISRNSRNEFVYDMRAEDWAWREIKVNDHEGVEFEPLGSPSTGDDWYFTAFSINTKLGFSIISEPVIFSSKRNLMVSVTGPATCFSGEQVSLQVDLISHLPAETLVLLTLKGSPDYKFVNVAEDGIVSSYSAQLTSGDQQLLIYLGPGAQEHVDLPVAPSVEQGDVEMTVTASAQTGQVVATHTITVQGGGAMINKHTSVFLDLKSRALVLSYLDIIVEETPIIPYDFKRRYVYGSTSGSLEVFGDIIGPVFSSVPATMETTLKRSSKGTLARVFEFGANIWTLHYLRLTNKLQRPFLKEVLLECNIIYAQIMKRFHTDGSFKMWDSSGFSVWLTALTLRLLKAATYPDWEFLMYVDPAVSERGAAWLLSFQAPNGSFYDTSTHLDSKMNTKWSDVSLTAHVLMALSECLGQLSGEVRTRVAIACERAAVYLEQRLTLVHDPYALAVAVYALSVSMGRGDTEQAFYTLMSAQRTNTDGFIYWSPGEIPANPVKKENQRPFVQPRFYHEDDSVAVETTAWVLLIILHRDGVTETSEKIVHWLNSVRMTTGGFISTLDTLVALQSLAEYAFRSRLYEVLKMDVTVDFPMTNTKHAMHIDNSTVLFQSKLEIPVVWGSTVVLARGSGQAIVQMDINYGVDHESLLERPSRPTFDLNVTENYSTYRNKSALTVRTCFRWLLDEPAASSAATLEIDSPSGYRLLETNAEALALRGSHPSLRDGLVTQTKTVWFFEQIKKEWSCFNFTLRRWFPVANISLHRRALLYETTARERFVQVLVNSTPLYVLNICEVCGSYQCPYCPYYNSAVLVISYLHILILSQLLLFM